MSRAITLLEKIEHPFGAKQSPERANYQCEGWSPYAKYSTKLSLPNEQG